MHRRELLVSDVRAAAVPEPVQLKSVLLEQLELVSALACLEQPVRLVRERQELVPELERPKRQELLPDAER